MRGRVLGVLLLAVACIGTVAVPPAAALVLDRPVPGRVLEGFDAPTRYGPGHRGVDLAAGLGSPVRAAAPGRVTFAGRVVDAVWVTVDHGSLRTTVGPLGSVVVSQGDAVARGAVVGTSDHAHGRPAVHWSARRGDVYVDPLAVGREHPAVATLVPLGHAGAPTRPWPATRVR